MILIDANVLIYTFRRDMESHDQFREWLEGTLSTGQPFGAPDLVLAAVVRITTHPKVFVKPSSLDEAAGFVGFLRDQPGAVHVAPGPRHWPLFIDLCRRSGARGNLVTDAYLAALAIESGSEWITTDRDFARFPGLRWRHPLDGHPLDR